MQSAIERGAPASLASPMQPGPMHDHGFLVTGGDL